MTTIIFDNKICDFKILLSWHFHEKSRFGTVFLSAPKAPPSKTENYIFIVVSPSLIFLSARKLVCANSGDMPV